MLSEALSLKNYKTLSGVALAWAREMGFEANTIELCDSIRPTWLH